MLRKYLIWQLNLITPASLSGFAADVEKLADGSGRKEQGLETGQLLRDEIRAVTPPSAAGA